MNVLACREYCFDLFSCHLKKSGSLEMENDQTCAQVEINVEVRLLL